MSLLDSIKKGLFDQEDDYEDQYIDDGPQMVNNNNGIGLGADDENEEPVEGAKRRQGGQHPMPPLSSRSFWSSLSVLRMPVPLLTT